MFPGLIPGLNSLEFPDDEQPSNYCVFQDLPYFLTLSVLYTVAFIVITIMLASLVFSLSSKTRKGVVTNENYSVSPVIGEAVGELQGSDSPAMTWSALNDAIFHDSKSEVVSESDAKYAEELQIQEALLASLFTSQTENSPFSSTPRERPSLSLLLNNHAEESPEPSQSFCEICLENKETWQMFKNSTCSHSFCYDCTSKHITAKIQDNITKAVKCPEFHCKSELDFNLCRLMVPQDILVQWDESLCKSMILESQKLYCPFSDCSVLLVNDNEGVIQKIDCPICHRSFCATCQVPWHSEFTCKEFGKLNSRKKKGKEDDMVEALAKKKNWRKCPSCKFIIEKAEGCLHITCRCKYEFCYRCRSKWSSSHGGCRPRS